MTSSASSRDGGLRKANLSQWETIAQSLAVIAPTGGPAMLIPLVLATSGRAAWFVFLIATIGVTCIGREINVFARRSSSPGNLYTFVHQSLRREASIVTGWALVIAYTITASAVTGGITNYCYSLFRPEAHVGVVGALVITCGAMFAAGWLAYRDIQVSTQLMLIVEACSIAAILLLFLLPGRGSALHFDKNQLLLADATAKQIRSGLVLAIFAYVGFESATSLGEEAIHPLISIPRAVSSTVWLSGLFFIISAYAQDIGYGGQIQAAVDSTAPLHLLAQMRGLPLFSPILAATTVCSFFACALACINAGARTLYRMGRDGFLPSQFGVAHKEKETPHIAVVCVCVASLLSPIVLILRNSSPLDLYGWLATFATFGFLTAYALVAVAGAMEQWKARDLDILSMASLTCVAIMLSICGWSAFDSNLDSTYKRLPYMYLTLIALGTVLTLWRRRGRERFRL